jgi:hypothetical protein
LNQENLTNRGYRMIILYPFLFQYYKDLIQ